jgi:hypothetical protein
MFVEFQSEIGQYDVEWCIGAIEQAKGNENEARRWLERNAVRRTER